MSEADVKSRLRPFGFFFEKSLTDLIKGIRANRDPEAQLRFLQDAIAECRKEVKSRDMDVKTMAVLKLSYLEMYGFDMGWANFHVLEVMSSQKFQQKRVGYLAAIQSFKNDNDVLMLTTNLLKKDINSGKPVEVGVALSGISNVVTPALATDVVEDTIKMLNHSKPYIRKKAVLAMYKIFLKYPEALRTHLPRIFEKLDDPDDSVITATVTVICELSKKTPKMLVSLAPHFYNMLKSSSNNWMLIRLLKLFSNLTAVEPRLKGKLLNPVLELMAKTKASSLVFECVNCLVTGNMIDEDDYQVANLCLEELVQFFKEDDSNLRYVGLLAFLKIGKINPRFITKYSDYILQFLEDDDVTIREKSLELVSGIANEDNCFDIVKKLMVQLVPEDETPDDNIVPRLSTTGPVLSDGYKTNIVHKILQISSQDNYTNIPSFEWYLAVISDLLDLSIINSLDTGENLGEQLRDIAVRVPSVRKDVISTAIKILNGEEVLLKLPRVLKHVIWLTGEYSEYVKTGDVLIQCILIREDRLLQLEPDVLSLYIPAIVKIYNSYVNKDPTYWDVQKSEQITTLTSKIIRFFEKLSNSKHFEIQERSVEFLEFLKLINESIQQHDLNASEPPLFLTSALPSLFDAWELNPISQGSQRRLSPPEFDIDSPIHEDAFDNLDHDTEEEDFEDFEEQLYEDQGNYLEEHTEDVGAHSYASDEVSASKKKERMERLKDDPYYLQSNEAHLISPRLTGASSTTPRSVTPTVEVEDAPKPRRKKNVVILTEEFIGHAGHNDSDAESMRSGRAESTKSSKSSKARKRNILLDSSNLERFDFDKTDVGADEEVDGAAEVAKLRQQLEQHTKKEEPEAEQEEVIVIRKKKKKEKKVDENGNPVEKKKKKKKKVKKEEEGPVDETA